MNLRAFHYNFPNGRIAQEGSVLVIVLMIAIGLISIALYFANSMTMEMRASDNRTSGLASDQAIEGAARYVTSILANYATNGAVPYADEYSAEAVPVGNSLKPEENSHFWIIGRDPAAANLSDPYFALVDEASKLNLNAPWFTNADTLFTNFSGMTAEFADAIMDWKNTNGSTSSLNYSQLGYLPKSAPFESVGELRLVYGATLDLLQGEDVNRNGILDPNEQDLNGNGQADPGLLDYFTVYSREPNVASDGTSLTNVNSQTDISALLQNVLGSSRANEITTRLFPAGGQGGGGGQQGGQQTTFASLLDFYIKSQMTSDEFAEIYDAITVNTNSAFTIGRVNINTAPAAVLACLPGMDINSAQQVVNYRQSNSVNYNSIAWIVDALGGTNTPAVQALAAGDYITAKSFQFSADIAALGPFGRGYRRVRFVFDTTEGTPKIIYRQDLGRLGWALGRKTRDTWVAQNTR